MIKTLNILLFICIPSFYMNCKAQSKDYFNQSISNDSLVVNFEYGEDFSTSSWKNIYAIWMEDTTSGFLQNIFICQKLITGGLTGTVLPYWKINKYPESSLSEIDAVTSATQANTDFSVSAILKNSTVKNFVLYFEMDRYAEPNDWFSDQPALLYSANISVDNDTTSQYELSPTGWTPNEATTNVIPNTPFGKLQKEMRYITNHKNGESFGDVDERSATRMVGKITATFKSTTSTKTAPLTENNLSISLFPNPMQEKINIKSNKIISEVILTNLQGKTIFQVQPETYQTAIIISQAIIPAGTYIATIKTSDGVSIQKIQIVE